MKKGYLVLSDGTYYEGIRFGADHNNTGELVFTTAMEGYLETLTDPSYAGQIVVQTFPLIGNYGVIESDFEGECAVHGYVVHELCHTPSNFRAEYELDEFLKSVGVCGLSGVDTRAITRKIREGGITNARICSNLPDDLSDIASYRISGVVADVSCKTEKIFEATNEEKYHVVLIDYGAKKNIIRSLCTRGCRVTVVPQDTTAHQILAQKPDGIMLSNGPGDPAENRKCIREIAKLMGKVPMFGICLGHQLTALAMGGRTEKLYYGHRGVNQPVREISSGRTYITSQNHGYAVISDSLNAHAKLSFINANDGSCEGIEYPELSCFTVQFHPEASAGPHDTSFLFDRFIGMMEKKIR